jgi:hypothetical protein
MVASAIWSSFWVMAALDEGNPVWAAVSPLHLLVLTARGCEVGFEVSSSFFSG